MRTMFSIVALLFALALSATAAPVTITNTTTLSESFSYWNVNFPGGYANGNVQTRKELYTQQSSSSYLDWMGEPGFDATRPWTSTNSYSDLSEMTAKFNGTTLLTDPNGNSGDSLYLYENSSTHEVNYLNSTLYPLENLIKVNGGHYDSQEQHAGRGINPFDCRELVAAHQSGACAGSNVGTVDHLYRMIGGNWFSFDILLTTGTMSNFNGGTYDPYENRWTELVNEVWKSTPFNTPQVPTSGVPEPGTYGLMGLGLAALSLIHRRTR